MRHMWNGWVIAGLSVVVVVWLIMGMTLFAVFAQPAPHEVHTPGSAAVNARLVEIPDRLSFVARPQPSESIDAIRCEVWHARHSPTSTCAVGEALAAGYFPTLTQTPKTLYIPWNRCRADGFNLEYQSSRRSLVIHCYTAQPWIYHERLLPGVAPARTLAVLVVSTESLPAGDIAIVEEDRIERPLRDRVIEFEFGTATIS
jgi:hypothetical protein